LVPSVRGPAANLALFVGGMRKDDQLYCPDLDSDTGSHFDEIR
jgi:hypothetical protein